MCVGHDRTGFNSWTNWFSPSYFFLGSRRMSLKTPLASFYSPRPSFPFTFFHSVVWASPIQNLVFSFVMSSIQNIIWPPFWMETYEVPLTTNWKETWTSISIETKKKIVFSQNNRPSQTTYNTPKPKIN